MPAWRLDAQDRRVCQFDVGAIDGPTGSLVHVVLCSTEKPLTINRTSRTVPVIHMGPPLRAGEHRIDVLGTSVLEPNVLQPSELRKIKTFLDDRSRERKAQEARLRKLPAPDRGAEEYVIHPAYLEPEAAFSLWRFNCAGFVLRAYQEADIFLLDLTGLPAVSLAQIKNSYPHLGTRLDDAETRKKLGIGEGTAWPVVLPGYLVNSLARQPDEIRSRPFSPAKADEFFPPRQSQELSTEAIP